MGYVRSGVFFEGFFKKIKPLIEDAYNSDNTDSWYWEDVYMRNIKHLSMFANKQNANQVYEFESLDDIRLFDPSYLTKSHNKWLELISDVFKKTNPALPIYNP